MGFRVRSHRDVNHKPIQDALERAGCRVADLSGAGNGVADLLVHRVSTGLLRPIEVKNPETSLRKNGQQSGRKNATRERQEEFRRKFPMTRVVTSVDEALAAMGIERAV